MIIIDWIKFAPALVLLLTPVSLFYGDKIRYRDISRDWGDHWVRMLTHGLHAIDFGRAALGTWLLFDSLQSVPNAHGLAKYAVLMTAGSIRILAVFLQTVLCPRPDSAIAPFAFVTGMLLTGSAPLATVFALALAIPITMGLRAPIAFFPLVGVAHLGMGFWFNGKSALFGLSFGVVATFVPLLWSLMFHRDLLIAYRARRLTKEYVPDQLR